MLKKISKTLGIFVLILVWFLSGRPVLWQNPRIPPKIHEALAAITFEQTLGEDTILPSVSVGVSAVFPDDLIYDGSIGSVGLTLEPLLSMRWWGIAVYNETDNFVSGCVSTALPLPIANFNLEPGDYKTAISLGETKEECEAFGTAEYPLFAVVEAANFTVK